MGIQLMGKDDYVIHSGNLPVIYESLFTAMKDYTLDRRGDVGAWVREASMSALQSITVLAIKTHPQLVTEETSSTIFRHLLQQATEKIDRTRAHAGTVFFNLLHHQPEIPGVPERERLKGLFPHDKMQDYNWAAPADTFPLFTQLLNSPAYSYSVLLGLTISVGGLTESLVKHSSLSLFSYMSTLSSSQAQLQQFADILLKVFTDHQKMDRVTVPMLKMLDQLLSGNYFRIFTDEDSSSTFGVDLFTITKKELLKCGDPQKLLVSVDVFCGLLEFPAVRRKNVQQLCIFLCHKYPIVRKKTGYKLYEALLTYDELVPEDKVDEIMTLLSDTLWDKPVAEVRPIRNQLCDLFGVPQPTPAQKGTADNK